MQLIATMLHEGSMFCIWMLLWRHNFSRHFSSYWPVEKQVGAQWGSTVVASLEHLMQCTTFDRGDGSILTSTHGNHREETLVPLWRFRRNVNRAQAENERKETIGAGKACWPVSVAARRIGTTKQAHWTLRWRRNLWRYSHYFIT